MVTCYDALASLGFRIKLDNKMLLFMCAEYQYNVELCDVDFPSF